MGAATSGGYAAWFSSGVVDVVLVLNDARNIVLQDREELNGVIHLNADDSGNFVLTRESPATLSLSSTKIVEVEFKALLQGHQETSRCLGEVFLPLHHIAKQCAGSLYQVWLPLQPVSALSQEDDHIAHFDKAMVKAAKDPRKPMVCISLYAGSIPQASRNYLFDAPEEEKAKRFLGLLQSHSQHARMLQALYREVRISQTQPAQHLDSSKGSKDGLADSWSETPLRFASGSPVGFAEFSPEADASAASPVEDQRAALLEEIKETRTEADERIHKAEKTIQALKEMINDKQVELIQRRKEVSRLRHEAESLQLENEKLELQLSRSSLQSPTAADTVEAANLRREAEDLSTHKEALQLILRDFYRAMGQEPPSMTAIVSKHQAATQTKVLEPDQERLSWGAAAPAAASAAPVPSAASAAAPQVQEWTNMLPRPSELLLSGLDERFARDM